MTLRSVLKASVVGIALLGSGAALAKDPVLNCPAGTKQAGGFNTPMRASMCIKFEGHERVFHGPYVGYHADGTVSAVGQYENGNRHGKFEFFDNGVKSGETEFSRGDFHGTRVTFHANGQKRVEERWVAGKRQGTVREFDASGQVVRAQEYKDNRVVAAK
jgi:hypothetical protein